MLIHRRFLTSALFLLIAAIGMGPAPAEATPAPAAIEEGRFVDINGVPQWITIRGRDSRNPVLLILHGGPGFATSFLAPLYADWERSFTIVQWDQPGSGSTGLRNLGRPSGPMTIERFANDAVAVTLWVRQRLGVNKVVLFGSSWGSLLGIELAHRRPELFSAYVGTSQPVGARGALVGYQMALDAARRRGDAAAIAALTRIGPPPYRTFEDFMVRQQYSNPPGLPATPEQAAAVNELIGVMRNPQPGASYVSDLPAPPGFDGGLMAAIQATWQEAWSWEARPLGMRFAIPMFIFQGEVDVNTPTSVAREYFDEIEAPVKRFEIVPGAGHDVMLFHDALLRLLEADVLPVVREPAGNR